MKGKLQIQCKNTHYKLFTGYTGALRLILTSLVYYVSSIQRLPSPYGFSFVNVYFVYMKRVIKSSALLIELNSARYA